jgi:Uma2 family endonuclease
MTTATLPTPAVTPPPAGVPTPRPFRWTVQQFHDASERKVFGEGNRVILLRGELVELGPMNPLHATAVDLANETIRAVFAAGWRVRVQSPLVFGLETDPLPDISVFAGGGRDFLASHPGTAVLVVEVADSSLFIDTTTKAELYATAGVRDYWVLDLQNRVLLVYRDAAPVPDGGMAYGTTLTLTPTDSVSPLAMPSASIRVADLLP